MSDAPEDTGGSNCEANLSQKELDRLALIIDEDDCACAMDVGDAGQLVMSTDGDIFLVVEDEDRELELSVCLGSSRAALNDLIRVAQHMLTHIN